MEDLQVRLVGSTGLLLEYEGFSLLIDSPSRDFMGLSPMDPALEQHLFSAQPPFAHLAGLVFTHTHPDHYDPGLAAQYLARFPACGVFLPRTETPDRGSVTFGPFTVDYARTGHLPLPKRPAVSQSVPHCCLLVRAGGGSIYVSGDAPALPEVHGALLDGRKPDRAFWNPMYLGTAEMRQLMTAGPAKENYVYHLPTDPADRSGIRRKAQRSMERYAGELQGVSLLYPEP